MINLMEVFYILKFTQTLGMMAFKIFRSNQMIKRVLPACVMALSLVFSIYCSGSKPVRTEPEAKNKTNAEETSHPILLNTKKDKTMYKVYRVIKHFGKLKVEHIPVKNLNIQSGSAVNPDAFYDVYELDVDEKGYWFRILFKNADRAIRRSRKVKQMMAGLPVYVLDIRLKTPAKKLYMLSDADADGILDFAAPLDKNRKKLDIDIKLLQNMQEKYRMILRIIKKYYKQVK
jgi:hypothetical protein